MLEQVFLFLHRSGLVWTVCRALNANKSRHT